MPTSRAGSPATQVRPRRATRRAPRRERVIAATIRTPDGRVHGGGAQHRNHALVILAMLAAGVPADLLDRAEAGFATTQRPHVSRATAARVAGYPDGELDSVYLTRASHG